jgi:hypothetical protein
MVVDHHSHLHCNQGGHHYIIFTFFQLKSPILREASPCYRAQKQTCSAIQNLSWRPRLGPLPFLYYVNVMSTAKTETVCLHCMQMNILLWSPFKIWRLSFKISVKNWNHLENSTWTIRFL